MPLLRIILSVLSFYKKIEFKIKFKGAQVWDFDVLDFYDFFIMKSI
jgi:hypothetical protein